MVSSSTKLPVVARKHAIAEVACYKNHVQTFLVHEVLGKLPPERPLNPSASYPSRWNHLAQLGTPNSIAWSILPYRHLGCDHHSRNSCSFQLHWSSRKLMGTYFQLPTASCRKYHQGTCAKNQLFTMKKEKNRVFFSLKKTVQSHSFFRRQQQVCPNYHWAMRRQMQCFDLKSKWTVVDRWISRRRGSRDLTRKTLLEARQSVRSAVPRTSFTFRGCAFFSTTLFSWKGQWMKKGMNENTCLI